MHSYDCEMLSRVNHGRSTINYIEYIELTYFIFTFEYIPYLFPILIHFQILRGSHPRNILSNEKIPLISFTDKIYETQRTFRIKFVIRNHNTADIIRSIDSRFIVISRNTFRWKKGTKEEKKNNRVHAHVDIKEFRNISEVNKSLFAETINANNGIKRAQISFLNEWTKEIASTWSVITLENCDCNLCFYRIIFDL